MRAVGKRRRLELEALGQRPGVGVRASIHVLPQLMDDAAYLIRRFELLHALGDRLRL
jgi:hypothetical protein